MFTPRFARHVAKRYRKRGLDRTARRMVDFLDRCGLEGMTVMEIGGGVGEIQIELVKRGAASATSYELSSAYDAEAERLARDAGLTGRLHRRLQDVAVDAEGVEAADVVVLHRVVCCYPDYERLLGAAADLARDALVFSHPPRNLVSRMILGGQNLLFRLGGKEFRTFAHPPDAMREVLRRHGLRPTYAHRGPVWQVVGAAR